MSESQQNSKIKLQENGFQAAAFLQIRILRSIRLHHHFRGLGVLHRGQPTNGIAPANVRCWRHRQPSRP